MLSSTTRQLLRRTVNLKAALEEDDNVLTHLQYTEKKKRVWSSLAARKAEIGSMICYQLGVGWCHDPCMHFGDVETRQL